MYFVVDTPGIETITQKRSVIPIKTGTPASGFKLINNPVIAVDKVTFYKRNECSVKDTK